MGRSAVPRDADRPLAWRGFEPPDDGDLWTDDDSWSEDDELAAAAAARSRRLRSMAVLGVGGLLLATVVVTGFGADDPAEPGPTTVGDPLATTPDPGAGTAGDPEARSDPDPDIVALEGGLRYGGAGGGADIRRPVATPVDAPLVEPASLAVLPPSVDTSRWQSVVPADVSGGRRFEVVVAGGHAIVLITGGDTARLDALAMGDGTPSWSLDAGPGLVRFERVTDDVLVLTSSVDGVPVTRWIAAADGSVLDPASETVVGAAAWSEAAATVEIDPADVDPGAIEVGPGLTGRSLEVATGVADGSTPLLAAELVARDRLVGFVGDALVGIRASEPLADVDDPGFASTATFTLEWARPGVLLFADPNERGASLLVSNLRGNRQEVVDAASGRTITELAWLASRDRGFTTAANGVVVRQPATIGSALVATDLDGGELWRITGSPAFTVGDGVVVTATTGADGVVVTAWS